VAPKERAVEISLQPFIYGSYGWTWTTDPSIM